MVKTPDGLNGTWRANIKALLLDGSLQDEMGTAREAASSYLRDLDYMVEVIKLNEREIADCTGCFGCWVKTPGRCLQSDDANEVTSLFLTSDLVVLLTPITFGGYSYHLKKALDRSICFSLPFFHQVRGEVHHPRRYDNHQRLVVIGLLHRRDEEAQRVYRQLAERNSFNLQPIGWSAGLVFSEEKAEMSVIAVKEALIKAGVKA